MINEEISKEAGQAAQTIITYTIKAAKESINLDKEIRKKMNKTLEKANGNLKRLMGDEIKIKDLYKKGQLENISIDQSDIKDLKKELNKLGVSFSVMKNKENQNYEIFFQAKDIKVMEYAFKQVIAKENKKEKEVIAANAIHMVKDHMCIFLDASSTAYTLGMKLTGFTELTVITNGIDLALALKDIPGITVILTGGIVTSASSSIEGLLGVDLLQKIHTDIAFVSARGFSVENGLTDFSIYEADLKRMCIKASAKTIALIDHTKFDTSSISSYASIDDLNLVITDSGLSENTKEIYEKAGVDLLIAD